jgi:hypothetical protein
MSVEDTIRLVEIAPSPAVRGEPVGYASYDGGASQKADCLSETDRLRGEVAHTKLRLAQTEVERGELALMWAQSELARARKAVEGAQQAMDVLHTEIAQKYEINWETHRVREGDGKIITVEEAQAGASPR